jgi:alpha-L-fucosidase
VLADVVAHGGNLLINVGPDGTGRIPDRDHHRHGRAGPFTHKDGTVYAMVLADHLTDTVTIRDLTLPREAGSVSSTAP